MKNKLCYLVDIIENNEDCVILQVKDNKEMDLIKLGCFNGDERLFRLTKGKNHTCTIFYNDNRKTFSWEWGEGGFTMVTDDVSKMGKLIENAITEDFDIYIGGNQEKIEKSLNIKTLDDSNDSKHFIEIMYFKPDVNVIVHKDFEFYKSFPDVNTAIKHFQDLYYDIDYKNKYVAVTGCIVEEYNIQRNLELLNFKEKPSYFKITDIKDINEEDSFTIARVMDGVNCVELHYNKGRATIEYGTKIKDDEWENEIEEVDWFNKDILEKDLENKLWKLFEERYDNSLNNDNGMEI